ncbi:hypothetical protein OS187_10865 [Xanthomonadaceae bacterium JHOS43]|nr:hypothetical protein [Xanthomonadaceae bacterium JHOS43]
MPRLLRNILAIAVGLFVGSIINTAIVALGPGLIPPPAGVDVTSAESLAAHMHLFEPRHFVMPLLAHAIGTLTGALVAWLFAASHKSAFAYGIGAVFLCGGIAACFMIPAPVWFMVLDLVAAYLPMAWLAIRIGRFTQSG